MSPSGTTPAPAGRINPATTKSQSRPTPLSQPKLEEMPAPQRPSDQPAHKDVLAAPITATSQLAAGQATLNWEAIQNEIATSFPNIAPFLEAGRFLGIEGGLVTIGFSKQATLARTRLEKEEYLMALAALCQKQSGIPVRIRIVELTESDPPGPTMAQIRTAKEQDQRLVLFEQARANPTVKRAIEIFGAELAEVRRVAQKEAIE
jgi:DNA polymerase-3 subunit gamma/tau